MVTKIKMVPLDKVKDSPFRNKKRNPIDTDKVKHIAESVTATDFWKGIQGREVGDFVEVAFGHHRIDAARLLGMKEIPIEVLKLSDAEMLQRMTRENLRGDLPAALEVVEATIKAYAAGVVKLDTPSPKTRKDVTRYAPSYKMASSTAGVDHPYTADTLARFLGGVYLKPVDKTAQDSIPASLGILELEERGVTEQIEKSLRVNDVDPSGRYKSAKHVRRIVEETKERVVKAQERAEKTAEEVRVEEAKQRKLQADIKEREDKEREEHEALLSKQMDARLAENKAEAKRLQGIIKEKAAAAEVKAEADVAKLLALEVGLEEKKKAVQEQRKADEYLPLRREAVRIIHVLERRDLEEDVKALARKPLNANDREMIRQAAINAGSWYSETVAALFLPPITARNRATSKEKK
jgi:hypothetical protein